MERSLSCGRVSRAVTDFSETLSNVGLGKVTDERRKEIMATHASVRVFVVLADAKKSFRKNGGPVSLSRTNPEYANPLSAGRGEREARESHTFYPGVFLEFPFVRIEGRGDAEIK